RSRPAHLLLTVAGPRGIRVITPIPLKGSLARRRVARSRGGRSAPKAGSRGAHAPPPPLGRAVILLSGQPAAQRACPSTHLRRLPPTSPAGQAPLAPPPPEQPFASMRRESSSPEALTARSFHRLQAELAGMIVALKRWRCASFTGALGAARSAAPPRRQTQPE